MIDIDNFFFNKNVLITGGTGYIGFRLYKLIKEKCSLCTIIGSKTRYIKTDNNWYDVDIRDKEKILSILRNTKYDIIFHLAALIQVNESIEFPLKYFDVNTNGTLYLLEAIRKTQNKPKIIFNSSGLVYGNVQYLPIRENHPIDPNNPYSASKAAAENIIVGYSNTYGFDSTIFRLFTVYGPNQYSNLLIPSIIKRCLNEEKIRVGNLYPTRDFIYIQDVVSSLIHAAYSKNKGVNIYNIASGKEYKIGDVINMILHLTKRDKKDLIQDENLMRNNKTEIKRISVDISKAKKELNWEPKVSLQHGLEKCIAFESK